MKLHPRTAKLDDSDIDGMAATHQVLQTRIKDLSKEKDVLHNKIMGDVSRTGNRSDKGDIVRVTDSFVITNQRRTRIELNEEKAVSLLKKKGLLSKVQKTQTYLDEQELLLLVEQGQITRKELASIAEQKVNWALYIEET